MKRCFKSIAFKADTLFFIEKCNDLIAEAGEAMTLREIYYQFIGRDWVPDSWIDPVYNAKHNLPPDTKNTVKNYKRLGGILADGRIAGLIDWDGIEDRGRVPKMHSEFEDLDDVLKAAVDAYHLPRWRDQPNYVELWIEKDALSGVFLPVTDARHIHLGINKGYGSVSALYEAAQRFEAAQGDGKECTLLYFGDHDPSGEDMVRDVRDRLELFGAPGVNVEKVALTMAQVRQYRLPPNPAKTTDSRARAYIAEHGNKSWELDALRRNVMREMADAAVVDLIDDDLMSAVLERETDDIAALKKVAADRKKKSDSRGTEKP